MSPHTTRSDSELLTRFAKAGDGDAFAALVERHLRLVSGVAYRRTGSKALAQEAAQNTFCRLAQHAPRLKVADSLAPWLHAVAVREAGTLMRSEAAHRRTHQRFAAMAAHTESETAGTASPAGSEFLDEALATLPDPARRVVILRYLKGLSLREVAASEQISEEAARKRVHRALERLTRLFARRGLTAAGVMACLAAAPHGSLPFTRTAAEFAACAIKQVAGQTVGAGAGAWIGLTLGQWPAAAVFLMVSVAAAWPWDLALAPAGIRPARQSALSPESPRHERPEAQALSEIREQLKTVSAQYERAGELNHRVIHRLGGFSYFGGVSASLADARDLAALRLAVAGLGLTEVRAAAAWHSEPGFPLMAPALFARWAELAPEEAWEETLKLEMSAKNQAVVLAVLEVLGRRGPAAVLARVSPAPQGFEGYAHVWADALVAQTARHDPALAVELAASGRDQWHRDSMLKAALCAVLPQDPGFVLDTLRRHEEAGAPLKDMTGFFQELLARGLPAQVDELLTHSAELPDDSEVKRTVRYALGQLIADDDPARAAELVSRPMGPTFLGARLSGLIYVTRVWFSRDAEAATAWLTKLYKEDPDNVRRVVEATGLRITKTQDPSLTPVQ